MNEYFLTGGTGVVGNAIARDLLARADNRVSLLVRAASDAELDARLQNLMRFWELESSSVRSRIEVFRGDITLPRFGLASEIYDRVAHKCTHIIHCAALVRMSLPLPEARKSAVGAAENVVRLAQHCQKNGRLKKVEFLSTVGVGGHLPGVLAERWVSQERRFHNTYEQAKAEAEDYIRDKTLEGLPVTVHRPSMVVGDSQSGRIIGFQIFYHLCEFLTGGRTFGVFPSFGSTKLDLVPVDYVSAAVVWSSTQAATVGRVLHLCSGPTGSIPLGELQRRIREHWIAAGAKLPPVTHVPLMAFRTALPMIRAFSPAKLRRALGALPIFLNYLAESQAFESTATSDLLEKHGIVLYPIESYLHKVLAYYLLSTKEMDGSKANKPD